MTLTTPAPRLGLPAADPDVGLPPVRFEWQPILQAGGSLLKQVVTRPPLLPSLLLGFTIVTKSFVFGRLDNHTLFAAKLVATDRLEA
jgi:hypothetical protein